MKYKHRLLEQKLLRLGKHFPAIVLTGARQVGKTTLFQHLQPKAQLVTFDPVIDINNARQDPELFLNHIKLPVILDEIQYAPELLSVIKRRIDQQKTPGQYWITGSQNLNVLKKVSESLAGRAAVASLLPMSYGETLNSPSDWFVRFLKNPKATLESISSFNNSSSFHVFSTIWHGGYPGMIEIEEDIFQQALESYFHTYIERDIRLMANMNDLHDFSRFTQLLAHLTAQEINYNQLGREIAISPHTARHWLNILIDTYQWTAIPPFAGNAIKRLSGKHKGYFIDTGLVCYLMHLSSPSALPSHPRLGALFETLVAQDILKQLSLLSNYPAIYHWRSHGGAEVDLLLELDNTYFPIEIKCKSRPTYSDTKGIQAFRETYKKLNIGPGLIICLCDSVFPLTKDDFAVPFAAVSVN